MNLQKIQAKKHGISPIIATLLLILIAIAAGVILYAYVVGFIGNSTTNPGGATSVLSISNFCASTNSGQHCTVGGSGSVYSISMLNTGSTTIASGAVIQLYFTDVTSSSAGSGSTTCTLGSNLAPGGTAVCPVSALAAWTGILTTPSSGDTITVKAVAPDGGASTSTTKAI